MGKQFHAVVLVSSTGSGGNTPATRREIARSVLDAANGRTIGAIIYDATEDASLLAATLQTDLNVPVASVCARPALEHSDTEKSEALFADLKSFSELAAKDIAEDIDWVAVVIASAERVYRLAQMMCFDDGGVKFEWSAPKRIGDGFVYETSRPRRKVTIFFGTEPALPPGPGWMGVPDKDTDYWPEW